MAIFGTYPGSQRLGGGFKHFLLMGFAKPAMLQGTSQKSTFFALMIFFSKKHSFWTILASEASQNNERRVPPHPPSRF